MGWLKASRVHSARAIAWRVALAALVLMPLVAFGRFRLGNDIPLDHALRFWQGAPTLVNVAPQTASLAASMRASASRSSSSRAATSAARTAPVSRTLAPIVVPTNANTRLEERSPGWWQTVWALPIFAGEWAQALGPRGLPMLVLSVLALGLLWFILAQLGEWRRPCVPLLVLLALQGFGSAYYLSSFRAPARRMSTRYTAFDFHAHTTHSSGLLTPQQQIEWHRARGFRGLAFTDSDLMMNPNEFAGLQAANPDMLLLNGCEYHGGKAHLILLGLKTAVSSRQMDVPQAIREAKKQGAIVIAAHPWSPNRYSAKEFLQMGVDGFEAWNGAIWDARLADLDRERRLIATSATDTWSKSGARCFTWTLLPTGMKDGANVLRALRLRKTAIAFALDDTDTSAAFDARQHRMKGLFAVPLALGAAWRTISRAQRINTLLGLVACGALLWVWGAQGVSRLASAGGPQRAVGFLRRRRISSRIVAAALMAVCFLGSIAAAVVGLSWSVESFPSFTPLWAFLSWLLLDALFLYALQLWRRVV